MKNMKSFFPLLIMRDYGLENSKRHLSRVWWGGGLKPKEPSLSFCLPANKDNEVRVEKIWAFHKCHVDFHQSHNHKVRYWWSQWNDCEARGSLAQIKVGGAEFRLLHKMADIRCDNERLRVQDVREEKRASNAFLLCVCVCVYSLFFISSWLCMKHMRKKNCWEPVPGQ